MLLAIVVVVLLARGTQRARVDETPGTRMTALVVPGTDTAPASAPTASQAMGAYQVRTVNNALTTLAVPGKPTIVMVSSRTCGWCNRALADLGEFSDGRPLPNLTLLTLEGATEGQPMVDHWKVFGARLVGPSGSSDQVLLTFRYPGTPTFVAIDRNGRVVRTMPGYPSRAEMRRWYAVMAGDQETP